MERGNDGVIRLKVELSGWDARRLFHLLSVATPRLASDWELEAALLRLIEDIEEVERRTAIDEGGAYFHPLQGRRGDGGI